MTTHAHRTIQPPLNDPNFTFMCENTASVAVFGHIRMATSVVHAYNNHPFVFGRHSFMHNGAISHFTSIQREMTKFMSPEAFANIKGSTDSEHLAGLYFTFLKGKESWKEEYTIGTMKIAMKVAVQLVLHLQAKIPFANGEKLEPSSLNICTTDGSKLLAFRFRNAGEDQQPPSLYVSTTAGPTLNRMFANPPKPVDSFSGDDIEPEDNAHVPLGGGYLRPDEDFTAPDQQFNGLSNQEQEGTKSANEHGKHAIVASEPFTYVRGQWDLVDKNTAVSVDFSAEGAGAEGEVIMEKLVVPLIDLTEHIEVLD